MDLPSHVLYTYAFEEVVTPTFANNHQFVISSLIFSSLPDLLETTPFLIYLYFNKNKYNLKGIKSVIIFASDITHNKQDIYDKDFSQFSKISFYTHSFLIYIIIAGLLYLYLPFLFLPFVIGYGLHLFIDIFLHNDYFSARPFYPLSNLSVPGFFTWYKDKKFSFWNYGILILVYILMFLFIQGLV